MAIGVVFELPGVTQEQYEQIVRDLAGGAMTALSDWPVEGILCHIAGPTEAGWRVVDVWESEEALGRFAEKLMPAMQAAGVNAPEPRPFELVNFVKE